MLAVLSPAKKLDFTPLAAPLPTTRPVLLRETEELMKTTRRLSAADLQSLMRLSTPLAELNYERFQAFSLSRRALKGTKQAALAFDGDTYAGLRAREMSPEDLGWAQDRLRILSGLYGVLRPLDLIQPYRLEMGTRLANPRSANLYGFWGDKIAQALDKQASKLPYPQVVNLSSKEYFTAAGPHLKTSVLTCTFLERRGSEARVIGFCAKRARGMMARFMIQGRFERPEALKDFRESGYRLDRRRTTGDEYVFVRDEK